jgi:hypothetical protein
MTGLFHPDLQSYCLSNPDSSQPVMTVLLTPSYRCSLCVLSPKESQNESYESDELVTSLLDLDEVDEMIVESSRS